MKRPPRAVRRWLMPPMLLVFALGLSVCAKARPSAPTDFSGRTIDWNRPPFDGVAIDTIDEATSYVPFDPVAPDESLGPPQAIYMSDPAVVSVNHREVAYIYKNEYGQFFVLESVSGGKFEDLSSKYQECAPKGCVLDWKAVTLDNGLNAVVGSSTEFTGAEWFAQNVHVLVIGPTSTFTMDAAQAVANAIPAG